MVKTVVIRATNNGEFFYFAFLSKVIFRSFCYSTVDLAPEKKKKNQRLNLLVVYSSRCEDITRIIQNNFPYCSTKSAAV